MTIGTNADAVTLKSGREKPVRQGHPWIFSGAIQEIPASAVDGEPVDIQSSSGTWLARGYLNRQSQIQIRILTWDPDEVIDAAFWQRSMAASIARRADLAAGDSTVYRLINAESDFLPGLTVDRYGDYLVVQSGTLAIDRRKAELAAMLGALTGCRGVLERSEAAVRRQEGLEAAGGLLWGQEPPATVLVTENGFTFPVNLWTGQKGGFYADQRLNRGRVAAYCPGRRVLNMFSYTGAFGIYALAAGATHVTNVDSNVDVLETAEETVRLNGFEPARCDFLAGDAAHILRDWRAPGEEIPEFDVIILDPPKFAQNKRHLERALRGYKDINMSALQMLKPGGILATFSCSGLVSADLFQKVVFGAAVDAGRRVQVLEWLRQAPDHPIAITFPEGEYLKGLICRVL